jgi:hypothetical protein
MGLLRQFWLPAACVLLGSIFVWPPPVRAATITWGPATNISGPSDVITTGTYVDSATFFGSDVTVNGVTFNHYSAAPYTSANGGFSSPSANSVNAYDLGFANSSQIVVGFENGPDPPSNGPGATAYEQLLSKTVYEPKSPDTVTTGTITLGGLTIGQQYQVEVWSPYYVSSNTSYFGGNLLNEGSTPQYIVGRFTANAASQVISLAAGPAPGPPDNSFLGGGYTFLPGAVELRTVAVPEPGSVGLLGLGTIGLLMAARRKR